MGRVPAVKPVLSDKDRKSLLAELREAKSKLLAAVGGTNWQAYTAVQRQITDLLREDEQVRREKAAERAAAKQKGSLSASQAGPALVEAVMDAPRVTQWDIYQRLAELPGFADGDDEEEDEEEPEERPPLRAVKGGKK